MKTLPLKTFCFITKPETWGRVACATSTSLMVPAWFPCPVAAAPALVALRARAEGCLPAITPSPGAGTSQENHSTPSHSGRHSLHSELLGKQVSAQPPLQQRGSEEPRFSNVPGIRQQNKMQAGLNPSRLAASNHQTTCSCQRCFNSSWWAANEQNRDKGMGEARNALHFS